MTLTIISATKVSKADMNNVESDLNRKVLKKAMTMVRG